MVSQKKKKKSYRIEEKTSTTYTMFIRNYKKVQCTVEEHAVSENGIIWMQVNTVAIYDIYQYIVELSFYCEIIFLSKYSILYFSNLL